MTKTVPLAVELTKGVGGGWVQNGIVSLPLRCSLQKELPLKRIFTAAKVWFRSGWRLL